MEAVNTWAARTIVCDASLCVVFSCSCLPRTCVPFTAKCFQLVPVRFETSLRQVRLLLLFDCRPMAPVNLLETERRLSIVPTVVQSPEIAQIRRENQLLHRVSGKALRRSEPSLSSSPPASPSASHEPRLKPSPTSTPSPATTMRRSVCGSENTTFVSRSHAKIGFDEDRGPKVSERRERSRRIGDGLETNAGHAISESSRLSSPLRRKHSMSGVCGEDSSAPALVGDDDHGIPTVSPRTSDIWAWALIVLQMFSDEAWAPGSGQVCTCGRLSVL